MSINQIQPRPADEEKIAIQKQIDFVKINYSIQFFVCTIHFTDKIENIA